MGDEVGEYRPDSSSYWLPPHTIHAVNIKTLRLYVSEEGSEEAAAAVEYGDSFTVNPTFTRVFRAFWV